MESFSPARVFPLTMDDLQPLKVSLPKEFIFNKKTWKNQLLFHPEAAEALPVIALITARRGTYLRGAGLLGDLLPEGG